MGIVESNIESKNILSKKHKNLPKDYGLHLNRMGFTPAHKLYYYDFPFSFIAKLNNNLYTTSINIEEGDIYQVSLDFSHKVFLKLKGKIPDKLFYLLEKDLSGSLVQVEMDDIVCRIAVECHLGDKIEEDALDYFQPVSSN